MERECVGCGASFETYNLRRVRCRTSCGRVRVRPDHNESRTRRRATHELEFIAVDGEGVTRADGTHDYVLLSVGTDSYHRDGERLHWQEIFGFLYDKFLESPDAVFVGYFLGYDFTHWLRSLPENRARVLLTREGIASRKRVRSGGNTTPFSVECEGWSFDILGDRRFKLKPAGDHKWMYVCNVGSYFQTSFLSAIDPKNWPTPLVTVDEWAMIERGKERRSDAVFDDDMLRYNVLENQVLSRLMRTLNKGFVDMGIKLAKDEWYGPGQAVVKWLQSIGAPRRSDVACAVPEAVLDAGRQSYYGGWFEIFAHGHVPGVSYDYDINSAYPHAMKSLPCLLHGRWTQRPGSAVSLVYARVRGSDPHIGVMPHRCHDGTIHRPSETMGWYWQHEIDAAIRAGLIDDVHATDCYSYERGCSCPPPLEDIARLYQYRLEAGKNTPTGRAAKLVYNSAYGKMAQSVGAAPYANPIYASLITSHTRTMILNAIATHPLRSSGVLMIATDGVVFSSPHPSLDISPETLGDWSGNTLQDLTLFMPGVYWDNKTRQRVAEGGAPALKSRGISARDLARRIADIDDAFVGLGRHMTWPSLDLHVSFAMTSALQALARGKWETCGHVSSSSVRHVSSNPQTKRNPLEFIHTGGVVYSTPYPYPRFGETASTPYSKAFGMALQTSAEDVLLTPDGTVQDVVSRAFYEE